MWLMTYAQTNTMVTKICLAVITGKVDDDLQYIAVGPVVYSRWLTLGCRTCRYYVSVDEPSQNLEILVNFCLTVCFPTWFELKLYHQITHGCKNLSNLMQRIVSQKKMSDKLL